MRIWVEAIDELGAYFGISSGKTGKGDVASSEDDVPMLWTSAADNTNHG